METRPAWREVVRYWLNTLKNSDRLRADYDPAKATHVPIGCLRKECLPPEILKNLFPDDWEKSCYAPEDEEVNAFTTIQGDSGEGVEAEPESPNIQQFWILPAIVETSEKTFNNFAPVWIESYISSSGKISPKPEEFVWFYRECLDPSSGRYPDLGEFDAYDRFVAHKRGTVINTFHEQLNYADEMLLAVTGYSFSNLEVSHDLAAWHVRNYEAAIMPATVSNDFAKGIISLYFDILKNRDPMPLLARFAAPLPVEQSTPRLLTVPAQRAASVNHLGQMNAEHPLSDSQKETMAHYLSMPQGEVLAVNGPPGTGKTTLLQSIVGTESVKAALAGASPPVMVATSTNNQAVLNILGSFSRIKAPELKERGGEPPATLYTRWLPLRPAYGIYWSNSGYKKKEAARFFSFQRDFAGYQKPEKYLRVTDRYLLHKFKIFLMKTETPWLPPGKGELLGRIESGIERDVVKEVLHACLVNLVKHLKEGVELSNRSETAIKLGDEAEMTGKELDQKLAVLLTRLREAEAADSSITEVAAGWKRHLQEIMNLEGLGSWPPTVNPAELDQRPALCLRIEVLQPELRSVKEALAHAEQAKAKRESFLSEWNDFFLSEPDLWGVLRIIGYFKEKIRVRNADFLEKRGLRYPNDPYDREKVTEWLKNNVAESEQQRSGTQACLGKLTDELRRCEAGIERLNQLEKQYAIEERVRARNSDFIESNGVAFTGDLYDLAGIEAHLGDATAAARARLADAQEQFTIHVKKKQSFDERVKEKIRAMEACRLWCGDDEYKAGSLEKKLDTEIRYQCFCLASRYWEVDFAERLARQLEGIKYDKEEKPDLAKLVDLKLLTAAMCPLTVSTCHSLPGAMKAKNDRPFGLIDLLIVDESGQVGPEYAGGSMALAKKTVCVGDSYQLQPVVLLPWEVDKGQLLQQKVAMTREEVKQEQILALSSSRGSVMKVAQQQCRYQKFDEVRGLMLTEHRRCADEIIAYCNKLIYKERLIPKRPPFDHFLPHMAHMLVRGFSTRQGTSRINKIEAGAIATWIANNADCLVRRYSAQGKPKKLKEIVGIVTPFTQQAMVIKKSLAALGRDFGEIQAGTVHSFQGAEFPIVLFSGTYGSDHKGNFFFDTDEFMLNVAVSRAKDTFIWVGDTSILPKGPTTPSGLLSQWILKERINSPLELPKGESSSSTLELYGLDDHYMHIKFLRDAFAEARKSIIIVSPWIRDAAIEADRLYGPIRACVERGVAVCVLTDRDFNLASAPEEEWDKRAERGIRLLLHAGAAVKIVAKHHDKQILIDDTKYAAGSFNWLSATRDERSPYLRKNVSVITTNRVFVAGRAVALRAAEADVLAVFTVTDPASAQHCPLPVPPLHKEAH